MNQEIFFINETNTILVDEINNPKSYYGCFYRVFNNEITLEEYLQNLKTQILSLNDEDRKTLILKILSNTILNHLKDFLNKTATNYNSISQDINKISKDMNCDVENTIVVEIFQTLRHDLDKMCYYYYLYYKNIYDNFEIDKYPMEIIVLEKNKYYIYEGIHRYIFCEIKKVAKKFNVIKSNCKVYNDIINTLTEDYELMYKNNYKNFVIYNKTPHILFDKYQSIREDRSPQIIKYLSEIDCKRGLEIGPHNGLLTVELTKAGYQVSCVEYDKKYFELSKNVVKLCDLDEKIEIIHSNIYDYKNKIEKHQYDFIVSLSVFYHLKRNNSNQFESLFNELLDKTKILIFDDEPNTEILTIKDIKSYIRDKNLKLNILHKGSDDRTIYSITKD